MNREGDLIADYKNGLVYRIEQIRDGSVLIIRIAPTCHEVATLDSLEHFEWQEMHA